MAVLASVMACCADACAESAASLATLALLMASNALDRACAASSRACTALLLITLVVAVDAATLEVLPVMEHEPPLTWTVTVSPRLTSQTLEVTGVGTFESPIATQRLPAVALVTTAVCVCVGVGETCSMRPSRTLKSSLAALLLMLATLPRS